MSEKVPLLSFNFIIYLQRICVDLNAEIKNMQIYHLEGLQMHANGSLSHKVALNILHFPLHNK